MINRKNLVVQIFINQLAVRSQRVLRYVKRLGRYLLNSEKVKNIFPRSPSSVKTLVAALNGGFANVAVPLLLDKIKHGEIADQLIASAALTTRLVAEGKFEAARDISFTFFSSLGWKRCGQGLSSNLLLALIGLKRIDEARTSCLAAMKEFPDNIIFEWIYARLLFLEEKPEEALVVMNKCYSRSSLLGLEQFEFSERRLTDHIEPIAIKSSAVVNHKVSIIMPAFNAAGTIEIALSSLLDQTHANIEVIVVDDLSDDGTVNIVERVAAKDSRVILIRSEKNRGPYIAQNRGLGMATGQYVRTHGADDWSHPQSIEIQLAEMHRCAATASISYAAGVNEKMMPTPLVGSTQFLVRNMSSLLIEASLLKSIGGWDEVRFSGDGELLSRLKTLYNVEPVDVLKRVPLALLLVAGGSLTGNSVTGRLSLRYGARWDYRDSYTHWHRDLALKKNVTLTKSSRPFLVPSKMSTIEKVDKVSGAILVSDFHNPEFEHVHLEMLKAINVGALLHIPRLTNCQMPFSPAVREYLREGVVRVLVPGEKATVEAVYLLDWKALLHAPDYISEVKCSVGYVVVPESVVLDVQGFELARKNFCDLFGVDWQEIGQRTVLLK